MALLAQTFSRIGHPDIITSGWVEACNVDVTGYSKDLEFVLATYALANSVNPDSDFKLQWRRQGGSFADVAVDTEICWGTNTDLADESPVQVAAGCSGGETDDSVENEGNNVCHLDNVKNGEYAQIQWGLGFGSGALDSQEYEFNLVVIDWTSEATQQVSITT